MTMLHKIRLSTLDKWHEKDKINTGTWQELGYFVMYLKYYKRECTDANLMLMTVQLWIDVSVDKLEAIHESSESSKTKYTSGGSPSSSTKITASNITTNDIDASSFLKDIKMKLSGKSGVLTFYDNICVQSKRFNTFLCPSANITKSLGAIPDSMSPNFAAAMGTALHSKMSQTDTILD